MLSTSLLGNTAAGLGAAKRYELLAGAKGRRDAGLLERKGFDALAATPDDLISSANVSVLPAAKLQNRAPDMPNSRLHIPVACAWAKSKKMRPPQQHVVQLVHGRSSVAFEQCVFERRGQWNNWLLSRKPANKTLPQRFVVTNDKLFCGSMACHFLVRNEARQFARLRELVCVRIVQSSWFESFDGDLFLMVVGSAGG